MDEIKKAILDFCKECSGDGIESCVGGRGIMRCPLYDYRLGEGRPTKDDVHKYCLLCQGEADSVHKCRFDGCPLYQFRFGE